MSLFGSIKIKLNESSKSNELAKFLKDSANNLYKKHENGCYRFITNPLSDLAIYIGWSPGFDPKDAEQFGSYVDENGYGVVAGIKIRNDADWAEFEFLDSPWYKNGEVYDSEVSISSSTDFNKLADELLDMEKEMEDLIHSGELLIELTEAETENVVEESEVEDVNVVEELKESSEDKKLTEADEPIMRNNALWYDNISLKGSGIPKHVVAVYTPGCLKVYNEEWGFFVYLGEVDTNSMENMSQYWFYNDYETNDEFKFKIDKAAKALYKKMDKIYKEKQNSSLNEGDNIGFPKIHEALTELTNNGTIEDYDYIGGNTFRISYGVPGLSGLSDRTFEVDGDTIDDLILGVKFSADSLGDDIYGCLIDDNDFYGYDSKEELEERIKAEEEVLNFIADTIKKYKDALNEGDTSYDHNDESLYEKICRAYLNTENLYDVFVDSNSDKPIKLMNYIDDNANADRQEKGIELTADNYKDYYNEDLGLDEYATWKDLFNSYVKDNIISDIRDGVYCDPDGVWDWEITPEELKQVGITVEEEN